MGLFTCIACFFWYERDNNLILLQKWNSFENRAIRHLNSFLIYLDIYLYKINYPDSACLLPYSDDPDNLSHVLRNLSLLFAVTKEIFIFASDLKLYWLQFWKGNDEIIWSVRLLKYSIKPSMQRIICYYGVFDGDIVRIHRGPMKYIRHYLLRCQHSRKQPFIIHWNCLEQRCCFDAYDWRSECQLRCRYFMLHISCVKECRKIYDLSFSGEVERWRNSNRWHK